MLDFQCRFCESDIQADYALIGDFVSCPVCGEVVIVPDPLLVYGSDYHGYVIERLRATSLLWNTYQAAPVKSELKGVDHVLLRIPTAFFLKRLTYFDEFCEVVVKSGSLNVKGIAPILSYSIVPGRTYFAFEYFPSVDLNALVAKTGPLDLVTSLRIMRRCALALSQVWNDARMIHQNILPHNIRINENREIRMMNLGLSQLLLRDTELLEQGFNVWDQRYISPEFALKGKADTPACDIYALGMVFYFLLTGSHPYSLVPEEAIPEAPIPDLKSEIPLISDDVKSLFQLMVAKRLSLRLSDWSEVLERIDVLLHKSKRRIDVGDFGRSYSKLKTRTDRRKPVALTPVIAAPTGKVDRKRLLRKKNMSETIARPVDHNKKTRHIQVALRNTRRDRSFASRYLGLLVGLAAAVFLVSALLLFVWSGSRTAGGGYGEAASPENAAASVEQSDDSVDLRGKGRTGEAVESPNRTPKRRGAPAVLLEERLKSALKYSEEHPDDFDEALKRLEAVIPEAVNLDRFDIVNLIREKTDLIAARKAGVVEDKVRGIVKRLRGRIAPLLKAGDFEKELALVDGYDGPLKSESLSARRRLVSEIKSIAESKKRAADRSKAAAAALAEKTAAPLLKGDLEKASEVLRGTGGGVKQVDELKSAWLSELDRYGKRVALAFRADSSKPDPASIADLPPMTRGLILAAAGDYVSAEKAFKELPEPAVAPFLEALRAKEAAENRKLATIRAARRFASILKPYSLRFDPQAPETLLKALSKAKISGPNAERLASETVAFAKENAGGDFMSEHANLVDAVLLFCKRNASGARTWSLKYPKTSPSLQRTTWPLF